LQENSGGGINLMRNADTFQLPPFEEANSPPLGTTPVLDYRATPEEDRNQGEEANTEQ
jgi:hypothetical protein